MKSLRTIGPHPDSVYDIDVSPDGAMLASACRDGVLRLWDWPSGDLASEVDVGPSVTAVRFSPNGDWVAMGWNDGAALVSTSRDDLDALILPAGKVESLAFTPEGDRLLVGDASGVLSEWDATTGEPTRTAQLGERALTSIEFVADRSAIVLGSGDARTWFLDPQSWDQESLELGHAASSRVYRATCGPDSDVCAASIQIDRLGPIGSTMTPDLNEIVVWRRSDSDPPRKDRTLVGHAGWIGALTFDPDSGLLASGAFDETIRIWDPGVTELVAQSREHEGAVYALRFTRDGQLLSASADGTIKLWDPSTAAFNEITREIPPLTLVWLLETLLDNQGPGRSGLVRVAQDIVDAILALGSRKRMEDALSGLTGGPEGDALQAQMQVWNAVFWVIQLRSEQAYRGGHRDTARLYGMIGELVTEALVGPGAYRNDGDVGESEDVPTDESPKLRRRKRKQSGPVGPDWKAGLPPDVLDEALGLEEQGRRAVSGGLDPRSVVGDAHTLYERAEALGHPGLKAISANLIGKLYSIAGDNRTGVEWFEQARIAAEALGNPALIGMIDGHLGNALRNVGRLSESRSAYQRVLDRANDSWPAEYSINALTNLAIVDMDLGLLRDARLALKDARARAQAAGLEAAQVGIAANLGVVYEHGGDLVGALEYYREALGAARRLGDRRTEASMLGNVAKVELADGDLDAAERDHAAAISLAEELGARSVLALSLGELGEIRARRGDRAGAIELLRRTLDVARPSATPLLVMQTMGTLADLLALGDDAEPYEAMSLLAEAAALGERMRDELQTSSDGPRVQAKLAAIYRRAVEIDSKSDNPVQGFLASEVGRASFLRRRLATTTPADGHGPEDLLPAAPEPSVTEPFGTLASALPALDRNTVLLSYLQDRDQLFTFVVRPSRSQALVVARPVSETLKNAPIAFEREVVAFGERGDVGETWLAVADDAFAPIAEHLEPDDVIYVVPHGDLQGLPIHALKVGKQRVVERWPVAYLPSSLMARSLIDDGRKPTSSLSIGVEFVREARRVAELLHAETLVGKRLSKRRVQAAIEAADAVHVSAHGFYSSERPDMSGILLQPLATYEKTLLVWQKESIDFTEADFLTLGFDDKARRAMLMASDIEKLRIHARLVTLSACSTGLIATGPGDDPSGLTTALLSAGARNIVASLWKVDPDTTEEFMVAFYRAIETEPDGWRRLPHALQAATREVMVRHGHPYFWAPFILIGGLVTPITAE